MNIEYDKDAAAAYINIVNRIRDGEAKRTIQATDSVILDFDEKGFLLGIEVLNAGKVLRSETLRGSGKPAKNI